MQRFLNLESSISSTVAASSSIGLTVPETVCTVMCSWWWTDGRRNRLKHVERQIKHPTICNDQS